VPYEWDEWAMRGLAGIEEYEVRQVLEYRHRWPRPIKGHPGTRVLTIWGRTFTGRALVVAVYHHRDFIWKIVGARDLTSGELAELTKWEASHDD
jgi:hypothetical protein